MTPSFDALRKMDCIGALEVWLSTDRTGRIRLAARKLRIINLLKITHNYRRTKMTLPNSLLFVTDQHPEGHPGVCDNPHVHRLHQRYGLFAPRCSIASTSQRSSVCPTAPN